MSVLDSLLEHFMEPLAEPEPPKSKPKGKGKPRVRHGKLKGLTDAALRARLKSGSGSTPAERQAAAALLQSRKDASEAHAAKAVPVGGDAAAPAVLEALLEAYNPEEKRGLGGRWVRSVAAHAVEAGDLIVRSGSIDVVHGKPQDDELGTPHASRTFYFGHNEALTVHPDDKVNVVRARDESSFRLARSRRP